MADEISTKIFNAIKEIQGSNDPEIFVKKLLKDALNWPIEINDLEEFDFDELGYDWNPELESMGFRSEDGIQDLFQIAKFPGWPLGMFIVRFGSNSVFTKGRGMTTPLRNLLRNLVEKVRPTASHQTWSQEQLLFMCHHEHTHYEFARFTNMGETALPKLQSFGWGPNDGDAIRTLCTENLPHLVYDQSISEEDNLENIVKAFDIQKVSRKFYSNYKQTFNDFKTELLNHAGRDDNDEIHRYVQLVFNRFLFLRFIEKKGWLRFGPDGNYLRNLYDSFLDSDKKFYKEGFLPMALEGLVVPGKQASEIYGEVELIGGGLFEPSPFDREFSDLPNKVFAPIIGKDGLLYKYNFTVQESTPFDEQVAIDPEMIGTMFEELVTDRDGKGAFYTPRVVVSYMCKEGIKTILKRDTEVSTSVIDDLVDYGNIDKKQFTLEDAQEIIEALDNIKAIDPACGSGAYMLGLLQELMALYERLQTLPLEFKRSKYQLKLNIISRSIFGVDIDPFATQITMLRLWLSLAVESEDPVHLPNLDFNIETGDGLLGANLEENWFKQSWYDKADELGKKKQRYLSATSGIEELRREIREEESVIRNALQDERIRPNSIDFRVHFANVFSQNGGFDLVLANPPYVKHTDIKPDDFRTDLYDEYATNLPNPVEKKSDIYCYFYIRAMQLLRPGGLQIFICSNTWLDVGFGVPLQNYLLKKFRILKIMDSAVEKQFSSADINTIITMVQKKRPEDDHAINFVSMQAEFEEASLNPELQKIHVINQKELLNRGTEGNEYIGTKWSNYLRAPSIYWKLIEEHRDKFVKLNDISDLSRGITSGCDGFFYMKQDKIEEWGIEDRFLTNMMKSSRESKSTVPTSDGLEFTLFDCQLPKERLAGTNALKYIEWGESQGYHQRASFDSNRSSWYRVRKKTAAELILPWSINEIYRAFRNDLNIIVHQRLYECNTFPGTSPEKLHSIMNSSIVSFMLELSARTGLGQGLLGMAVYEVANVLVPNPSLFDQLPVVEREIGSMEDEFQNAERLALDKIIFDVIGLTDEEVREFYAAYKDVVDKRLGRAVTVT